MRYQHTDELTVGQVVATRKISGSLVAPAFPNTRGAKRQVKDIRPASGFDDTLVITFTDDTVAATKIGIYWRVEQ